jgi:DNA-binding MarR family transcriptional regulator
MSRSQTPEDEIPKMLKKINDQMYKKANQELQKHNMTFSQIHVLFSLDQAEKNTLSLKELEKQFEVAQATMAGLVSRLEGKGLVEGRTNPRDKRIKLVHLTPAGRKFIKAHAADMHANNAGLVSHMSPQDQTELLRLLNILYETLRKNEEKNI